MTIRLHRGDLPDLSRYTQSVAIDALPMGLAHRVRLKEDVRRDQIVRMSDVDFTDDLDVVDLRRRQVREMGPRS